MYSDSGHIEDELIPFLVGTTLIVASLPFSQHRF